MKIIDKIQIRYFRSINDQKITEFNDINTFVGRNDSGKSNVLKALNLFFNNKTSLTNDFEWNSDYSKNGVYESKYHHKKQFIAIKVFFNISALTTQHELRKLAEKNGELWVERRWLSFEQSYRESYPSFIDSASQGIKRAFSIYVNKKIKYIYIPAFKDPNVFNSIIRIAGEYILQENDKKDVNERIKESTKELSDEFKKFSLIETSISLPIALEGLWNTLSVVSVFDYSIAEKLKSSDELKQYHIDFNFRGEGIKSLIIPILLDWITKKEKGIWIWGIDEPENSLEMINVLKLKEKLLSLSKNRQIFLTSHSPLFIFHNEKESKMINVYNCENNKGETICTNTRNNEVLLKKEYINIYGNAYEDFIAIQKELSQSKTDNDALRETLKNVNNHKLLFVEDTYCDLLKTAWLKLNDKYTTSLAVDNDFKTNSDIQIITCKGRGNLKNKADQHIIGEFDDKKIFFLFDFDDAYTENFCQLKKRGNDVIWGDKSGEEKTCLYKQRLNHPCFYAIMQPVPDSKSEFARKDFNVNTLTMEHLFENNTLAKIKAEPSEKPIGSGGKKLEFSDANKKKIRKQCGTFEKQEFINFKPIFEFIESKSNERDDTEEKC